MKIFITIFFVLVLVSCKKDETIPVSDQLKNVWLAKTVKEGSTTVFAKGQPNNSKPGYSQYKLDLTNESTAILTEFDGRTFSGDYNISSDNKTLTLMNLTPQPSGTGGTISYTIRTINETELTLVATKASLKTGGTINEYSLSL